MASPAERAHDVAVRHRIGLGRYSTLVVRKVLALLRRTQDQLTERLERTSNETVAGERLDLLLTELRDIQRAGWQLVKDRLAGEVVDLSGAEAEFAQKLAGISAQPATRALFSPIPPLNQIVAAVNARPFQGRFLREHLADAEEGAARAVRDVVRQGFIEGRPTPDIVRQIRGTAAAGYKDGILEITRRKAEAMVRTAMTHTANVAAQATWSANSDIIEAWQFVATLDHRTSLICAGLHGKKYPLGKGPQPPRHLNCRSTSVPVLPEIPGVVPYEFPSFENWLKKQSVETQKDVLGASRHALWRTGGVKLDRFTDSKDQVLTLKQLRAKDDDAFKDAGLDLPLKPPRGQPKDEIARFLADPAAQKALLTKLWGSTSEADRQNGIVRKIATGNGWKAEDHDLSSIRYYTGSGYNQINARMRSGGTLEDRQFSSMASRGLDDLPQEPNAVWRAPRKQKAAGDNLWASAQVGQELDVGNQLQSFSRAKDFAARWSGASDVLFHVRKPTGAAYIEPLSLNPGEEEVLFPLGLRYKVVAMRTETVLGRPYRIIELEVVS